MGSAKDAWLEQQEEQYEEERADWIREQLNNPDADEDTPGWEHYAIEYDHFYFERESDYYKDDWEVIGKSRLDIFQANINASKEILALQVSHSCQKNLHVMLHAHVVTAVEAYLSSTFIETTLSSYKLMRQLVETDPVFADRKFTIKDIFTKSESLKDDLRMYLKGLIFHEIRKVKPMYKEVFDIDFGETKWLFDAVSLRHDCVHRAGYDKEGKEAPLNKESINLLIEKCSELVSKVESEILLLEISTSDRWNTKKESNFPL